VAKVRTSRVLLEFSVGGLVFDEQGRVLLIRPRDLRARPARVALPKGALAPGESSPDAALREVREEAGLAVSSSAAAQPGRLSAWPTTSLPEGHVPLLRGDGGNHPGLDPGGYP
jgi:8-oxo-dGTP pyrophosphatase MutT (NUDIX family)